MGRDNRRRGFKKGSYAGGKNCPRAKHEVPIMPPGLRSARGSVTTVLLAGLTLLPSAASATPPAFERQVLTDKYYCDGVTAGDINRDGKADIVAGPFWYE